MITGDYSCLAFSLLASHQGFHSLLRSGVGHEVRDVFKGQMNQTKHRLTLLQKDTDLRNNNKLYFFGAKFIAKIQNFSVLHINPVEQLHHTYLLGGKDTRFTLVFPFLTSNI